MKVLAVEDDPQIVEAISLTLQISWPEVKMISTHLGREGVYLVESEAPDLVVLDLGLPDMSGFEVLKQIRRFSNLPVLILTVRTEEADIVKGLEWGADDYLVKPFRQLELLARIRALLRRRNAGGEELPIVCGTLSFDPETRQLTQGNKEISLTRTQALILCHLMKNAGRVVTHSSLAEAAWGTDYSGAAQSLRVHVSRLRQKIEADPNHPRLILSVPGVGYSLVKES